MPNQWQIDQLPNLSNKVYIVTGGNTGLGLTSVQYLSAAGADVILACRDLNKGQAAVQQLLLQRRQMSPQQLARIHIMPLNLTDPSSIKSFATEYMQQFRQLDGLLNNAGVVNLAQLQHTTDGHELHMATNHYGHFMLTHALFPLLLASLNARVVTVSSGGYKAGNIQYQDINWRRRVYSRVSAYGDSKLANILFTHGLQQRFIRAKSQSISVAAHPGLTASPRQQSIGIGGKLAKCLASDLRVGVAPQLYAMTAKEVKALDFYGPKFGIWGKPKRLHLAKKWIQDSDIETLWQHTELVTGCHFSDYGLD